MAHARIISIENPKPSTRPGVCCSQPDHSKWVYRRKYVVDKLAPQLRRLPLESVELFRAIVNADFVDLITPSDGGKRWIAWRGKRFTIETDIPLGCVLSHYDLWQQSAAENRALLVLEDDAYLPAEDEAAVMSTIAEWEQGPYDNDILYLQSAIPYSASGIRRFPANGTVAISENLKRVLYHNDFSGTAAYAIRPCVAQTLLRRMERIGAETPDGFFHRAFSSREIGIVVMAQDAHGFRLNNHWSIWNHEHEPGLTMETAGDPPQGDIP